jgi:hypothetical protein
MWNSNPIIALLLTRSDINLAAIEPSAGGRAAGWHAGVTLAQRQNEQ